MNPRGKPSTTKQLFDLDEQVSDDEILESAQKNNNKTQSVEETLYQQNMKKYMDYLGHFATIAEQAQVILLNDGATYVTHPLIQTSQINFQKNFGLFDLVDVKLQKNKNNYVKTMTVFIYLDNQVNKVIDILQSSLYDALLMYGEQVSNKKQLESNQIMLSRMFTFLRKIFDLVRKLMSYVENLVVQLHSIINRKQPFYKTYFKGINFDFAVNILGRALRAIYVIDSIIQNNPYIGEHWEQYKTMIKLAKKQPQKFNTTSYKLKKLQKMMSKFQNTILSGRCMEIVTQISFDETYSMNNLPNSSIKGNKDLREYLQLYLERTLQNIDNSLGSVNSASDQEKRLLDLLCVFSIFRKMYPSEDLKDFWKKSWSFQKKIPIIEAHSFVCVYISTFMLKLCPISKKPSSIDPKDQRAFIRQYIQKLNQKISKDLVQKYTNFCVWASRMESVITSNSYLKDIKQTKVRNLQEILSNRIHMICQGVNIIYQLNKIIYLCFMLHINQQAPISKKLVGSLILGMQSLKATAYMIKKKSEAFDTTILTKTIARDIEILLEPVEQALRKQCSDNPKKAKQYQDKLQAIKTIRKILLSPMSELKISIIRFSLNFIQSKSIIKPEVYAQIVSLMNKLQVICYYHVLVQKFQRCDYLYYCKDILPSIFQWKRENPNTCKRLQFLFDSFEDSAFMLKRTQHLSNNHQLFEQYKKYILTSFQENYMLPLKRKVQDFLRINIHCMLIQKLSGFNPFKQQMSDLIKLVQFEKIRIFDIMIDIKIQISKSFNETFYNMNTINIYDMETYEQMRVMADYLFGLNLHNVFLPNQTIAQGKFDIFNIVRNIPQFIQNYNYNLLSQRFLEVTTESKMISSITIRQISDSISTHGLGILSTTVNAFYKFMIGKIQAFNKFMHDNVLASALVRQKKWFRSHLEKMKENNEETFYPHERAKSFYKQIKKMARFQDQSNLVDKFREIITSIGNCLGFIRLLRSASLNYSSKSFQFLPLKAEIQQSLEDIANKACLSQTTKNSCKQLDSILNLVEDRFSDKIDYLNLMVKLFSKINSKENKHLQNFYLLIPVLSLNFVQHMTKGKQQINKKLSSKAFIYDDGLVLGIAYILCILKQNLQYKTLHWDSATAAFMEAAKVYSQDVSSNATTFNQSSKYKDELNMQNQLLMKKLQMMEDEFKFFHYNMISSHILFNNQQVINPNVPASPPTNSQENQGQQAPISS